MFPADAFFPVRTRGWDLTVPFIVPDCSWVTHALGLTPGYKMRPLHAMRVPKSCPASSTRTNKDYLHFRCIFYDRWQDFKITRGIHHNLLSFLYISYILKVILEKRKPGDLKRETNEPLVWLRCWKGKTSSLRTLDSIVTGQKFTIDKDRHGAKASSLAISLAPDLLFDCSRVVEYAKIRTVLQSDLRQGQWQDWQVSSHIIQ